MDWINYHQKLTNQPITNGIIVLYNAAGASLRASVIDIDNDLESLAEESDLPPIRGIIVDCKCYWLQAQSKAEAYYLAACLNAPSLYALVRPEQAIGSFGPRDIHRRPFEVANIPLFDQNNQQHMALSECGEKLTQYVWAIAPNPKLSKKSLERQVLKEIDPTLSTIDTYFNNIV